MANPITKTQLRKSIETVILTGTAIVRAVEGMTEHAFWGDRKKRAFVESHFITITDALDHLQDVAPDKVRSFSDAQTAIRFGEVIREQADSLDYGTVWRAIEHDLPILIREAEDLLRSI